MAGEWIKVETELPDKPEVLYIAGIVNLDADAVVGKLIRVWSWFDKHTTDGNALGVTFAFLDRLVGVSGFAEAMQFAGWLKQKDKTLQMPNFDYHTSESAKKRALTQKRQRRFRNANVDASVTLKALPEKRREEVNTTPAFEEFWKAYPRKESKHESLKAFLKLKVAPSELLAALERAKASPQWLREAGKFIPHASTWLNQRRFEDEPFAMQQERRLAI